MMWTRPRPPLARPATAVTTLLLVLTALVATVKSNPPAPGPTSAPATTDTAAAPATRRFEVRTLTPAAPLPAAYPALIDFELVNRSSEKAELFDINLWNFDLEIAADGEPPVRRPLAAHPMARSGFVSVIQLAPGESQAYSAFIGVLKPGTHHVRVLDALPDTNDELQLRASQLAGVTDSYATANIKIDDLPATHGRSVADMNARLERFDGYVARQGLLLKIAPVRETLLAMLTDVSTRRAAFAAYAFRNVYRSKPEPDLEAALAKSLAACDALPLATGPKPSMPP